MVTAGRFQTFTDLEIPVQELRVGRQVELTMARQSDHDDLLGRVVGDVPGSRGDGVS